MPVVSTAHSTQLPQELVEHYAQAISILELHLEKGQEKLTADAMRAKETLDDIIYSGVDDAIFALYPDGEIICQPSYWENDRYELQHFGRLVRAGGLLVVGQKNYRELSPDELYDRAWELREDLNIQLNRTIKWWGDINQAIIDGSSDKTIMEHARHLASYMDSNKSPAISTCGQEGLFTWGYPLREIGGLLSLGRSLYNKPITELRDSNKKPRVPDLLPEALDSILTLVTHPSAGFTPIGLASVANGVKATLAPLTHLEGLGDALVEANEDWQPVIHKMVEVNSLLSDYYARLQEKQP